MLPPSHLSKCIPKYCFSALNCKIYRVKVSFNLSHRDTYLYKLHVFSRLSTIYTDIENHLLWVLLCAGALRHMLVRRLRFVPLLAIIIKHYLQLGIAASLPPDG